MKSTVLTGDALEQLKTLPDCSINTCVTSPPYYGLRDYGMDGQIGLEETPEQYISKLVSVFREVRRVLRPDGTCFVNIGDSYSSGQSSASYGIIREDLTEEDLYAAAMGIRRFMPELWTACWGKKSEGALREVLSEEIQGGASRKSAGVSTQVLQQKPKEIHGQNSKKMGGEKGGGDCTNGREVRLLWRNGKNVSLFRPHQKRWAEGLRESGRSERGLEAGDSGRIAERQVSPSLLELQFGIRSLRILSSLKLNFSDIPPPVKIYFREVSTGLKPKDLIGIPWMLAFALRSDGWYLRQDIIWSKPNPMPESVTDRCTKSHEYIFLLSKSKQYYYDNDAIAEPIDAEAINGYNYNHENTSNEGRGQTLSGKRKGEKEQGELCQNGSRESGEGEVAEVGNWSKISVCLSEIRQEKSSSETTLREREREGDNRKIPKNSEGERKPFQRGSQETGEYELGDMRFNGRTMGENQKESELQMCDLLGGKIADQRPHTPVIEGRAAYSDKHSSPLPELQQSEEQHYKNLEPDGQQPNTFHLNRQNGGKDKTYLTRNKRSVWTVTTKPFKEAHYAVYPPDLIEPCILAGCPFDGTVIDPFTGSGTTGVVALQNGRNFIGIELNPKNVKMAERRIKRDGHYQERIEGVAL